MSKKLISIFAVLCVIGTSFAYAVNINAAELQNQDLEARYTVTDPVAGDLYVSADEYLVVEGDVDGDLFVGGGEVLVEGDVSGNVFAAGGVVRIEGDVMKSLYSAGGQVTIAGRVERNVLAAGGNLHLRSDVGESVFVGAGQLEIAGNIGEDLRASAGTLRITGNVMGDVLASGGTIDLLGNVGNDLLLSGGRVNVESESIGGNFTFYGQESNLTVGENVSVAGEQSVKEYAVKTTRDVKLPFSSDVAAELGAAGLISRLTWGIISAVGSILLGLVAYHLAPVKTEKTLSYFNSAKNASLSVIVGFIAFPVGIFTLIVLALTVVGLPLAGFLIALASIASMLATPFVGLKTGRFLLKRLGRGKGVVVPLTLGVIFLGVLGLIPCLGFLLRMLIFFGGTGAMLRVVYSNYRVAKAV